MRESTPIFIKDHRSSSNPTRGGKFSFARVVTHAFVLLTFIGLQQKAHAQYDVVLGTDNVPITKFSYTRNGTRTTQTSGNQSTIATNDKVDIDSIVINDAGSLKTLHYIDIESAVIVNNKFSTSVRGVGVYDCGTEYPASSAASWEDAMNGVVTSRNILNYLYYDGVSNVPSGYDFDVRWTRGLLPSDYLIVSERDGNTFFTITPLDSTGDPIVGARSIRFGYRDGVKSTNGNKKYDWNTGFASLGRQPGQPQYMSVIKVRLFNTTENIYGLRIDNNGEADVKFYGFSDSTFTDNPVNQTVPGLSGNVFLDSNGLKDGTVDGQLIQSANSQSLYVSLVQNNSVISTTPVQADGSYLFLGVDPGTYTTVVTTNSSGSTTPSLPSGWGFTGENHGIGAGSDGLPNGTSPSVSVVDTVEKNVNFGIQSRPDSDDKNYVLNPSPKQNDVWKLLSSNGMGRLSGSDSEDGVYLGNFPFVITDTSGMNGNVLFYDSNNNGTLDLGEELAPNDVVVNGDSTKLSVMFSGNNSKSFTFRYSPIDSAGWSDLSPATYFVSWADPLPVEWLSFEAVLLDNGGIELIWATASEVNCDRFQIQRSHDLISWEAIGEKQGHGTSTTKRTYNFVDVSPVRQNYYRIKQIDFDGSYMYSQEIFTELPSGWGVFDIYPMPVEEKLTVTGVRKMDEGSSISILNQVGRVVISMPISNQGNVVLNLTEVPAGVYYLRFRGETKRFVKL